MGIFSSIGHAITHNPVARAVTHNPVTSTIVHAGQAAGREVQHVARPIERYIPPPPRFVRQIGTAVSHPVRTVGNAARIGTQIVSHPIRSAESAVGAVANVATHPVSSVRQAVKDVTGVMPPDPIHLITHPSDVVAFGGQVAQDIIGEGHSTTAGHLEPGAPRPDEEQMKKLSNGEGMGMGVEIAIGLTAVGLIAYLIYSRED